MKKGMKCNKSTFRDIFCLPKNCIVTICNQAEIAIDKGNL